MSALQAAVKLLTIVPFGGGASGERALARSPVFFPVVGAAIGLASAAVWNVTADWFPDAIAAVFAIVTSLVLTGGLHIDGLADTMDGLFGGRSRARKLEIMSDPGVGAFGATAIALSLLLRWSILTSMDPDSDWLLLVVAATLSRATVAGVMTTFPYAREQGIGSVYSASKGLVIPVVAIIGVGVAFAFGSGAGLVAAGFAALVGVAVALYAKRKIGGLTGDVYGAIVELAELAALLGLVSGIATAGTIW